MDKFEQFVYRKGKFRSVSKKEEFVKKYRKAKKELKALPDTTIEERLKNPVYAFTLLRLSLKESAKKRNIPGLEEAVDACTEEFAFNSKSNFCKNSFVTRYGRYGNVNKKWYFYWEMGIHNSFSSHSEDYDSPDKYFDKNENFSHEVKLLPINEEEYKELSNEAKRFFQIHYIGEKFYLINKGSENKKKYVYIPEIPSYYLKLAKENFYFFTKTVICSDLEKRKKEIENFLYKSENCAKIYGRKSAGWEEDWSTSKQRISENIQKKEFEEEKERFSIKDKEPCFDEHDDSEFFYRNGYTDEELVKKYMI